jgi:hypothetical protein
MADIEPSSYVIQCATDLSGTILALLKDGKSG